MAVKKRKGYLYDVGRRKTASARVRFYENGDKKAGSVEVNGVPHDEYFPAAEADVVMDPIGLINEGVDGYFTVKVVGGGVRSQAGAVRHGITRILADQHEDAHDIFKQRGFLTRDPRMKERKKPGLKRARRAPQWSKR